jgi:hypothetical protein
MTPPDQQALFAPDEVEPDPVVAARPVGPVVSTAWSADGRATATFSACGAYRYRLSRVWDEDGPRCVFVMANPSTADHLVLDPTVRRCVAFARSWGCGALEVVNAFGIRSTDPARIRAVADPVGAGNDEAIVAAATSGSIVVAAWGVHGAHLGRETTVRALLADAGVELHALLVTRDGHPGHPLYVPGETTPMRWGG